jgi:glutaredoxin
MIKLLRKAGLAATLGIGIAQAQPQAMPAPTAALPYELARTVQASPVLLYTTAHCEACDQGRALLVTRGVPFSERTVGTREDEQRLRELSGKTELPLLLIGKRQIGGFEEAAWHEALTAASYPLASQLPPGYRQEPAQAAAPPPTKGVRAQIKVPPDISTTPPPDTHL